MSQPLPSLWRTVKTVAWSFLGIRKNSEFQEDLARVNPFHVIAVGIAGALIFVLGLVALVNWVVAK
jgi:Protein of unknown function (DUF2970)